MVTKPNIGEEGWGQVLNDALDQLETDRIAGDEALSQRISDTGWVDAFDFMDPDGWSGARRVRRILQVVYFQFGITAGINIDGTAKTDDVPLLDFGIDGTWQPSGTTGIGGLAGTCIDDANQLLRLKFTSSATIEIAGDITGLEATGNWVADTSYIIGQISWLAGDYP